MRNAADAIYARLDALGIAYRTMVHEEAHTMGDLRDVSRAIGAIIPKNLFLTPRNQSAFYLCLVMPDALFRTADISGQIGSSRLSFGPEDKLNALLATHAGAVSPLGLMFDETRRVSLLIDRRLLRERELAFHPNDNTQTLAMSTRDFLEILLPATGHGWTEVQVGHEGEGTMDA